MSNIFTVSSLKFYSHTGQPHGFDGTWHCGHSLTYVSFWNRFSCSYCKKAQGRMCGYKHLEHSPTTFSASFQFLRNELRHHRKEWMSSSKPTKCSHATENEKKRNIDVLSRSAACTRTGRPWCHLKNNNYSRHAVNLNVSITEIFSLNAQLR